MHRHPPPPLGITQADRDTQGSRIGRRSLRIPGSLSFPPASTLLPCSSSSCNPACRCCASHPIAGTKMGEHPDRKRQPPYTRAQTHTQAGESFHNLSNQQGWLAGRLGKCEGEEKKLPSALKLHMPAYTSDRLATCYKCAYTGPQYPCVHICVGQHPLMWQVREDTPQAKRVCRMG